MAGVRMDPVSDAIAPSAASSYSVVFSAAVPAPLVMSSAPGVRSSTIVSTTVAPGEFT